MALRMCRYPGCAGLIGPKMGGLCQAHQDRAKPARVCIEAEKSPQVEPRLYDSGSWRKARATFLRLHPICVDCGRPARVVDHIKPHGGDLGLFWDQTNWQSLCISCHNSKTNSERGEKFKSSQYTKEGSRPVKERIDR